MYQPPALGEPVLAEISSQYHPNGSLITISPAKSFDFDHNCRHLFGKEINRYFFLSFYYLLWANKCQAIEWKESGLLPRVQDNIGKYLIIGF